MIRKNDLTFVHLPVPVTCFTQYLKPKKRRTKISSKFDE